MKTGFHPVDVLRKSIFRIAKTSPDQSEVHIPGNEGRPKRKNTKGGFPLRPLGRGSAM